MKRNTRTSGSDQVVKLEDHSTQSGNEIEKGNNTELDKRVLDANNKELSKKGDSKATNAYFGRFYRKVDQYVG